CISIVMERKLVFPLLLLALAGMFLLGKGITGFVVSQSCCFPPDCDEENLCDNVGQADDTNNVYFGVGIIVMVVVTYFVLSRFRIR
ncbi:MAG: hypothetical protein ABIF10_05600, partial [Candidatus Woesearchaeota archaeon]